MKYKVYTALFLMAIALISGYYYGSISADAKGTEDKAKIIYKEDMGSWKYEVEQDVNKLYVYLSSPVRGKSATREHLRSNSAASMKIFEQQQQALVNIIMSEPLSTNKFSGFVTSYNIAVESYTIVARDTKGQIHTIFGQPVGSTLLPDAYLEEMVRGIEGIEGGPVSVLGVTSVKAKIDQSIADQLDSDVRLLGVDYTPALAIRKVKSISELEIKDVVPSALYAETINK